MLAYGSAATLFYWAKWMGKLVTNTKLKDHTKQSFRKDEEIPIFIHAALVIISCFGFPLISKYALIPYLTQLFHATALVPIGTSDVKIMLYMLSMLIILPIGFIPVYKVDRRRRVPIYMAGENTGDNENFHASMGITRKTEMRNWYMEGYFGVKKLTLYSNLINIGLLCAGIILLIGGLAK
jgi:ech hydrogenase subunit A